MSDKEEYVPTGHRIFRGGKRIEGELRAKNPKPYVVHQPGDVDADEVKAEKDSAEKKLFSDETIAAVHNAAEDIAARIANDRTQMQADILAAARAKSAAEDTEKTLEAGEE